MWHRIVDVTFVAKYNYLVNWRRNSYVCDTRDVPIGYMGIYVRQTITIPGYLFECDLRCKLSPMYSKYELRGVIIDVA